MGALLKSKKFKVTLAAICTAVAGGLTGELSWEKAIMAILGAIVAYIMAQGLTDLGKEKAKVEKEIWPLNK